MASLFRVGGLKSNSLPTHCARPTNGGHLGPIPYRFAGSNPAPGSGLDDRPSLAPAKIGLVPPHSYNRAPASAFLLDLPLRIIGGLRTWIYLGLAIASEVQQRLPQSQRGFTKFVPSVVVFVGFMAAFTIFDPYRRCICRLVGIGVAAITLISVFYMDQKIDLAGGWASVSPSQSSPPPKALLKHEHHGRSV